MQKHNGSLLVMQYNYGTIPEANAITLCSRPRYLDSILCHTAFSTDIIVCDPGLERNWIRSGMIPLSEKVFAYVIRMLEFRNILNKTGTDKGQLEHTIDVSILGSSKIFSIPSALYFGGGFSKAFGYRCLSLRKEKIVQL